MRGVCRGVFVRHCEEERARELRHVAAEREVRGGAHLVLLARCFVFVVRACVIVPVVSQVLLHW